MLLRSLAVLLATGLLSAQIPPMPASPQMRYVDFSQDLDRAGVAVVVGTLGKLEEGKRQRLAEGSLGSSAQQTSVSGTQYFKVPVRTTIKPRATFAGTADKLQLAFDLQLARLPDGNEKRQSMTGNGAAVEEDTLALFVVASKPKGKGKDLLHVIPFDAAVDKGPDAEPKFVDTMHDFFAVNQRVHDLRASLEAVDAASDAKTKKKALAALQELVAQKFELRQSPNDALVSQHIGPLELRAKARLGEAAAAEPAKGDVPAGGK